MFVVVAWCIGLLEFGGAWNRVRDPGRPRPRFTKLLNLATICGQRVFSVLGLSQLGSGVSFP